MSVLRGQSAPTTIMLVSNPILFFFLYSVFRFLKGSHATEISHDPTRVSTGFSGYLYYRGQHVLWHFTAHAKFPDRLYYSFTSRCYMTDGGIVVSEEEVKRSLDSMEVLFRSMPVGWDPLQPHMFQGRVLNDHRGQPLKLVSDILFLTSYHLKVVDSVNEALTLQKIKKLCKRKYGRLESINGVAYYRGHPVAELADFAVSTSFTGYTKVSFTSLAHTFNANPLDCILSDNDVKLLKSIVNSHDIPKLKSLLEEYPDKWPAIRKELQREFFALTPSQEQVDVFVQTHPEATENYVAAFRFDIKIFPDTIIDSPMIDLSVLVKNAIYSPDSFIRRVITRRSASLSSLQPLELDDDRLQVICQHLSNIVTGAETISEFLKKTRDSCANTQLAGPFEDLLKAIWLELVPGYVRRTPDVLKHIWNLTRGKDLEETKAIAEAVGKCFSTLRRVSPNIFDDVILLIGTAYQR